MVEMRNHKRALSEEEAWRIVRAGEHGVLATVGPDGAPYATPMNYVTLEGKIYLHCAHEGHKIENIAHESRVAFCVVGHTRLLPEKFSTLYESAIAFGRASSIAGEEKRRALVAFIEKYSADHMEAGIAYVDRALEHVHIIGIAIDEISGKGRLE